MSCHHVQLNLDYLDLLGLDEIVWIIEDPDNEEQNWLLTNYCSCLIMPYSANKLVPFSYRKIIDCLSFIERTDHLHFKDMMIVK